MYVSALRLVCLLASLSAAATINQPGSKCVHLLRAARSPPRPNYCNCGRKIRARMQIAPARWPSEIRSLSPTAHLLGREGCHFGCICASQIYGPRFWENSSGPRLNDVLWVFARAYPCARGCRLEREFWNWGKDWEWLCEIPSNSDHLLIRIYANRLWFYCISFRNFQLEYQM